MVLRSESLSGRSPSVSQRSRYGRHRRRRRFVTVPSVVGSVAVAAATSGALAMPATGAPSDSSALDAGPTRPQPAQAADSGALETVAQAGAELSDETGRTAKAGHDKIVTEQRKAAAEAAARAERESKRWVVPVSDYRITAGFGSSGRMWSSSHTGLDFAASSGTQVKALSKGVVTFTGWDGAYGNKIEIRHWDGTVTWYGHMSRFSVRQGAEVMPGDTIGRVGSTGNSTGSHLHLEVRPGDGPPVNPRTWLNDQGVGI